MSSAKRISTLLRKIDTFNCAYEESKNLEELNRIKTLLLTLEKSTESSMLAELVSQSGLQVIDIIKKYKALTKKAKSKKSKKEEKTDAA